MIRSGIDQFIAVYCLASFVAMSHGQKMRIDEPTSACAPGFQNDNQGDDYSNGIDDLVLLQKSIKMLPQTSFGVPKPTENVMTMPVVAPVSAPRAMPDSWEPHAHASEVHAASIHEWSGLQNAESANQGDGLLNDSLALSSNTNKLVLFSWVYGNATYANPAFKLFLYSVAGGGYDVVLLGDSIPEEILLPTNVRHVEISWGRVASLLENQFNAGQPLANFRDATYYKICDIKPLTALLLPELVRGYGWWGVMDSDLWLGNMNKLLIPALRNTTADYVQLLDVQHPHLGNPKAGPKQLQNWGPFSVLRNTPSINLLTLRGSNPSVILKILQSKTYVAFDEWGAVEWGGFGYEYSFSSMLTKAATSNAIVAHHVKFPMHNLYSPYTARCHRFEEGWDYLGILHSNNNSISDVDVCCCEMSRTPTASSGSGPTTLHACALDTTTQLRKEVGLCHFMVAKANPTYKNVNEVEIQSLLGSDVCTIAYTGKRGFIPVG